MLQARRQQNITNYHIFQLNFTFMIFTFAVGLNTETILVNLFLNSYCRERQMMVLTFLNENRLHKNNLYERQIRRSVWLLN